MHYPKASLSQSKFISEQVSLWFKRRAELMHYPKASLS